MRYRITGFTLIELLVVIAVLTVLAALFYPVLSRCKAQAQSAACLNNLHQIGLAQMHYTQDYDGYFPPIEFEWEVGGSFAESVNRDEQEAFERARPNALHNILYPYTKSYDVFHDPADSGLVLQQDKEQDILQTGHAPPTSSRLYVPLWTRVGVSYRAAAELGLLGIHESDIKEPDKILYAGDAFGWHPKNSVTSQTPANRSDGGDTRWWTNTLYVDGHVKTSPFISGVWLPYLQFIDSFDDNRLR
jgi:prepilin-type N-terminal cleavage/methylation domain-containing protein/prepilin-type processing-associated H-X9-DG protein